MLDYSLSKELKDAGFPQIWPAPDFLKMDDAIAIQNIYNKYPEQFSVYRPTLEELIEACGEDFGCLLKKNTFDEWYQTHPDDFDGSQEWGAATRKGVVKRTGFGKSAREAVARLWLARQKGA